MVTASVSLAERLPVGHKGCERCFERLMRAMRGVEGVVEVRAGATADQATVIYDADTAELADIEAACEAVAGASCELYLRRTIPIEGMHCADCALAPSGRGRPARRSEHG